MFGPKFAVLGTDDTLKFSPFMQAVIVAFLVFLYFQIVSVLISRCSDFCGFIFVSDILFNVKLN